MRLVIVGGSDAGVSAALRARELNPGAEVEMILADAYPNFSICGLPFYVSGEVPDWRNLAHRTAADIEAEGVRLRMRTTVTSIDAASKTLRAVGEQGDEVVLDYDKLVIATGAHSLRPPIAGIGRREDEFREGVFLLRWMRDAFVLDRHIAENRPKSALIVGSGYIGLEMADALVRRGLRVVLAGRSPSVLKTLAPELGLLLAEEMARHEIEVHAGVEIDALEQAGEGFRAHGDGFEAEADMVLVATGARPTVELAREAGCELGEAGAIGVNTRMETNLPDVFAAGDCVETWHNLLRKNCYLPLGTTAHKQGRVAGENAVGGDAEFAGSLGTQAVKVFGLVAARTGLKDDEARKEGLDPLTVHFECDDHKAYYPGATRMHVRLTGERSTGRLLGAQIVGAADAEVSKRVDVFAAAIHHGMRVAELSDLDLSYTPPLSSPWDPVQMAAQAWLRTARSL